MVAAVTKALILFLVYAGCGAVEIRQLEGTTFFDMTADKKTAAETTTAPKQLGKNARVIRQMEGTITFDNTRRERKLVMNSPNNSNSDSDGASRDLEGVTKEETIVVAKLITTRDSNHVRNPEGKHQEQSKRSARQKQQQRQQENPQIHGTTFVGPSGDGRDSSHTPQRELQTEAEQHNNIRQLHGTTFFDISTNGVSRRRMNDNRVNMKLFIDLNKKANSQAHRSAQQVTTLVESPNEADPTDERLPESVPALVTTIVDVTDETDPTDEGPPPPVLVGTNEDEVDTTQVLPVNTGAGPEAMSGLASSSTPPEQWIPMGGPLSNSNTMGMAMNTGGTVIAVSKSNGHVQIYAFNFVQAQWNKMGDGVRVSLDSTQRSWCLDLNDSGSMLVVGDSTGSGSVQVFRFFAPQQMWVHVGQPQLPTPSQITGFASDVAISGSGFTVAVGGSSLTVYTLDTVTQMWSVWGNSGTSALAGGNRTSINQDGTVVAIGDADKVTLYEYNGQGDVFEQMGQTLSLPEVQAVSLSSDSTMLAVGRKTSMDVFRRVKPQVDWVALSPFQTPANSTDLSVDGSVLAASGEGSAQVYERSGTTWTPIGAFSGPTRKVAVSGDGGTLAVLGVNGTVQAYAYGVAGPPTLAPTPVPTPAPTIALPSPSPSAAPFSSGATVVTNSPSIGPSMSNMPSSNPTTTTSPPPTAGSFPTQTPSVGPSMSSMPSTNPSVGTTAAPIPADGVTPSPSFNPSMSQMPSTNPSGGTTAAPVPADGVTPSPSFNPSMSQMPSTNPTKTPSVSSSPSAGLSSATFSFVIEITLPSPGANLDNCPDTVVLSVLNMLKAGIDMYLREYAESQDPAFPFLFNVRGDLKNSETKPLVRRRLQFIFEYTGEVGCQRCNDNSNGSVSFSGLEEYVSMKAKMDLVAFASVFRLECIGTGQGIDLKFTILSVPSTGPQAAPSLLPGPPTAATEQPSTPPSVSPSARPSFTLSGSPTGVSSSNTPSSAPTKQPNKAPAGEPSAIPSAAPSSPTLAPISPVSSPVEVVAGIGCADADTITFYFGTTSVNCPWVRQQSPALKAAICQTDEPAFYICPKTCERC